MSKYTALSDLKLYGDIKTDAEDTLLQTDLDWAEATFEQRCGSAFDYATVTLETPSKAWVARDGSLTLIASARGPVVSVQAVQYRVMGGTAWQTLSWTSDNILLPPASNSPHPRAWAVKIFTFALGVSQSPGDIYFRWSYTGGYQTTPSALSMILLRLALWKYKLREAPLGRVSVPALGMTEIIPSLPADIAHDMHLWSKVATG